MKKSNIFAFFLAALTLGLGIGIPILFLNLQEHTQLRKTETFSYAEYRFQEKSDLEEERLHKMIRLLNKGEDLSPLTKKESLPIGNHTSSEIKLRLCEQLIQLFNTGQIGMERYYTRGDMSYILMRNFTATACISPQDTTLGYWKVSASLNIGSGMTVSAIYDGMSSTCLDFLLTFSPEENSLDLKELQYIGTGWYNSVGLIFLSETTPAKDADSLHMKDGNYQLSMETTSTSLHVSLTAL